MDITLTPEITGTERVSYLIRTLNKVTGEIDSISLVDNERDAQLAIDSFAAAITKELTNEWTEVFRKDVDAKNKIILLTQTKGYLYNGSINENIIIDYIPVSYISVNKGRFERDTQIVIPIPPPLPKFEKIASINYEDEMSTDESSDDEDDEDVDTDDDY